MRIAAICATTCAVLLAAHLAAPTVAADIGTLSAEERTEGFEVLFNGRDLKGWVITSDDKMDADPPVEDMPGRRSKIWRVDHGALECRRFTLDPNEPFAPGDALACQRLLPANLEVRFKWWSAGLPATVKNVPATATDDEEKIGPIEMLTGAFDFNVWTWTTKPPTPSRGHWRTGIRLGRSWAQLRSTEFRVDKYMGTMRDGREAKDEFKLKPNDWNDVCIIYHGMRAIHRINGITVLDVDASIFAQRLAGLHSQGVTVAENKRFLLGWSEARARGLYFSLQAEGEPASFTAIRFRKLPDPPASEPES